MCYSLQVFFVYRLVWFGLVLKRLLPLATESSLLAFRSETGSFALHKHILHTGWWPGMACVLVTTEGARGESVKVVSWTRLGDEGE